MNTQKPIWQRLVSFGKKIWSLPKTISEVGQQRAVLNELEAERLDRIRNPSKYRGK